MNRSAGGAAHPHAPDTKIPIHVFHSLAFKFCVVIRLNTIIKSVHVSFLVQNRLVHAVNRRPAFVRVLVKMIFKPDYYGIVLSLK